jgi:Putative auto-transporter adhesin, head GIN domain
MKGWIMAIWLLSLVMITRGQETKIINDPNAKIREVDEFQGIKVSGAIELIFTQDPKTVVAISATDAADVDKIETEVRDGILYIQLKDRKNWWNDQWNTMGKKLKAYVSAPELHSISSAGSGGITIVGTLKTEELKLKVSGSGNINGRIEVGELEIVQSGSSNIRLTGVASKADFSCSGSGNVHSPELVVDYCEVSMSGSGNTELTVEKEISASVSGSGNIRYKGNGAITEMSVSGSGRIRKI